MTTSLNRILGVVLVGVLVASCSEAFGTGGSEGSATSVAVPEGSTGVSLTPAVTSSLASGTTAVVTAGVPIVPPFPDVSFTVEDVFVRDCDTQIVAADAAAEVAGEVHPGDQIGPLWLFGIHHEAPRLDAATLTPSSTGELVPQKYVTTLVGDDAVWLAVASKDRPYVSLIYDPTRWAIYEDGLPLDAGSPVVRFDTCDNPSGYTQYPGGLLVDGARCVTFEVWSISGPSPLATVAIPFGLDSACPLNNET